MYGQNNVKGRMCEKEGIDLRAEREPNSILHGQSVQHIDGWI